GHDAGLHGLTDRAAADDARGKLLDRIALLAFHRPFAVERIAQGVHHAPEQTLPDRHLQELPRSAHLATLFEAGIVAEDDDADLGFVEIQGEAGYALAEV